MEALKRSYNEFSRKVTGLVIEMIKDKFGTKLYQ